MIKAQVEERMENSFGTKVEVEGNINDIIIEFKGIVQSVFTNLGKESSLMFALLLSAIDEGVREAMEGECDDGQSEANDTEPSYEVRVDNLS